MKVLLMAYECSPYRGSEWAVGWGRLLEAARAVETHVVTSGENFEALERAQAEGLVPPGVKFYTPLPDKKLSGMQAKPGLFAYNYVAYHYWQKLAMKLVRELHARERFDLVHQVNVCTFREPGYTWQLGIPYLWGPVGGTQNFPLRFLSLLPPVEAFKEGMRGLSNRLSLRKPRVRAAAKAAAMIVAANSTNKRDYERVFERPAELLLETGLREVNDPDRSRFEERIAEKSAGREAHPLQILWSGELQTRKALPILLRALAGLKELPWQLTVLGDGPMRSLWAKEAENLGLGDRVVFAGRLPFPEAVDRMNHAELFCFTSLRDTSGNVVLEAMAAGVPVICFDHQGVGDMVAHGQNGIKVPVSFPQQAITDFAAAIREMIEQPERLLALSLGSTTQARKFLWSRNGDWVLTAYQRLVGAESEMRQA